MKGLLFSCLFASVALLTGCAAGDGRVTGPALDRVDLAGVTAVQKDAHLRATVQLKNDAKEPVRLRYRFTWLDGMGQPVGLGTPTDNFLLISLAPYETRYIQGDAPNAECADFRLYLQEVE